MEFDLSITGNLRLAISALSAENSSASDIFFWLTKARSYVNAGNCSWSDLATSEEELTSLLEEANKLQIIQEVRQLATKADPKPEELWAVYDAVIHHKIGWQDLGISQEDFEDIIAQAEELLED